MGASLLLLRKRQDVSRRVSEHPSCQSGRRERPDRRRADAADYGLQGLGLRPVSMQRGRLGPEPQAGLSHELTDAGQGKVEWVHGSTFGNCWKWEDYRHGV